jgi:hypothetical protein
MLQIKALVRQEGSWPPLRPLISIEIPSQATARSNHFAKGAVKRYMPKRTVKMVG